MEKKYKYSVGDKVITTSEWDDGFGRIIPKGSTVEIVYCIGVCIGAIMYRCLF